MSLTPLPQKIITNWRFHLPNPASRMNVFNIVDDKLFMVFPNAISPNFNGVYSIDRSGPLKKEMQMMNKYRPTRVYKLAS